MSVDELWALRLEISSVLTNKIATEKTDLKSGCGNFSQISYQARLFGVNDGLIHKCSRSIEIPPILQRPGRAVASSRAG